MPQDMSSPLVHSTSPQHQQYYPGHGLQAHSPTMPPSSPQKMFGSHSGGMMAMGSSNGQVVSSPFSSYEGRSSTLLSENADEFPPLNSTMDGNGNTFSSSLSSVTGASKMSKKDRRKGEFEGYNESEGFYDEMMVGSEMGGYHDGMGHYYGGMDGYDYEDEQDYEEQYEREREEERKKFLRHRKVLRNDIGELSDEERTVSSVISSLDPWFEDDAALVNRIRGGGEEYGNNPLLHAMPPLDDMPFINSDRDTALLSGSTGTFSISGALSSSQQQQQQMAPAICDEDNVFSYGPADFGYELFTEFYQGSLIGGGMAYQNVSGSNVVNENGGENDYMKGNGENTLVSSADNSNVVSGANSIEESGEYENSEGAGEDEDDEEYDDDDDDDEEEDDDDDDDDDEKARPRVLPRCSCCGGLILSLARNKKKTSNDNETDKSEGDNGNNKNDGNNGDDEDDDDDDVPPELVDPSNSEEEDNDEDNNDDDDDEDGGNASNENKGDGDDSENGRNEDGGKEKSSGVLPSILDGNGTVSATDHVAIHIPNSSILICPLYSRSSVKKNN